VRNRVRPEVVAIGEDGVTEADILVHRPKDPDLLYPSLLAQMGYPKYPMVAGILRAIKRPTYEDEVLEQIELTTKLRGRGDLQQLIRGDHSWKV
jgi:2-oxoglutarate ferredoxin oxidoreductase subunit beta